MKHVMLDLETLDTTHDACVLQIAAVRFDLQTGKTAEEYDTLINPLSSVKFNRKINEETLRWWADQNKSVRDLIPQAFFTGITLPEALKKLSAFVGQYKDTKVWGNGVLFDNAIIRSAWKSAGLDKEPWGFRADLDVRTLVAIGRAAGIERPKDQFEGVKHNALDDCKHQIKYCSYIYNNLIGNKS